jgi:hypothetical protein
MASHGYPVHLPAFRERLARQTFPPVIALRLTVAQNYKYAIYSFARRPGCSTSDGAVVSSRVPLLFPR